MKAKTRAPRLTAGLIALALIHASFGPKAWSEIVSLSKAVETPLGKPSATADVPGAGRFENAAAAKRQAAWKTLPVKPAAPAALTAPPKAAASLPAGQISGAPPADEAGIPVSAGVTAVEGRLTLRAAELKTFFSDREDSAPTQEDSEFGGPKPADWITGKVPRELAGRPHAAVHGRFFGRSKFDQLTSDNLTRLERDLRRALHGETGELDRAVLQFELATVLAQNRPTLRRAEEASRLLGQALAEPALLPSFRVEATAVQRFVHEMLSEPNVYKPLKQINWAISNRCPLVCKGCYFNFRSGKMTLDEARGIARKLKAEGVEEIIITGGDPLLAEDFIQYVDMLKALGFKVAVDTTGYTLTEALAKKLSGKLSYVGLPLDGATQEIIGAFRKGQNDTLSRVKAAISLLKRHGIPVKINTTVTKHNIGHLNELGRLIAAEGYASDWGWSVFQWWDTRAGPGMVAEYAVADAAFSRAISELQAAVPGVNVRVGSIESRSRAYFEIMTNGDVLNYSDGAVPGSIILGNLLHEPVRDLILSPALDKRSPKFRAWFSTGDSR